MPRPPWPFRSTVWRSPLRGPWLTSVFGAVLLVGIPLMILTGLLSYAAYNPRLSPNDLTPGRGLLGFYLFDWPTRPVWLYRLNQGLHVTVGIALVPILLAKLWSVIPKLFDWPPVRSVAMALERITIALLVGSVLFEFVTGILNSQVFYPWKFSFYEAHLYGAWVFIGAFVTHLALKLPVMVRSLRRRSLRAELRKGIADTEPEPPDEYGLVAERPDSPTISRRGALGLVAASSLGLLGLTAGQSIGGRLRSLALFSPRGGAYGTKPNDFPINKTAASVGIKPEETGPNWRLLVKGPSSERSISRDELMAMPQHTYDLPIACVEGWSVVATWTGVRIADLARMVGASGADAVLVESLEKGGAFAQASLSGRQIRDQQSLLALQVNGADLSMDHGFPARVIVPAAPGVHNTKWVRQMTFMAST
ncbi:MAG TPA: molybdopterin-dependent oxidoreductase [Acidimicrobiales bacterium]|nr:molybdopterin-dependent oxidoreductase [Acidimicrobiales bacterium]